MAKSELDSNAMSASSKIVTASTLAEDQLLLSLGTRTKTVFSLTWLIYKVVFSLVCFCSTLRFFQAFCTVENCYDYCYGVTNEINMRTFILILPCGLRCTCCSYQSATLEKEKTESFFLSQFRASGKGDQKGERLSVYISGNKHLVARPEEWELSCPGSWWEIQEK